MSYWSFTERNVRSVGKLRAEWNKRKQQEHRNTDANQTNGESLFVDFHHNCQNPDCSHDRSTEFGANLPIDPKNSNNGNFSFDIPHLYPHANFFFLPSPKSTDDVLQYSEKVLGLFRSCGNISSKHGLYNSCTVSANICYFTLLLVTVFR